MKPVKRLDLGTILILLTIGFIAGIIAYLVTHERLTMETKKLCSHAYRETNDRIGKTTHYRCRSEAECPTCGHCGDDCPGHQRQPGETSTLTTDTRYRGLRQTDKRVGTTAHMDAARKTGTVHVEHAS